MTATTGPIALGAEELAGGQPVRPGRFVTAVLADWCPFCREFLGRFVGWRPPEGWRAALLDLTELDDPRWEELGIEIVPTLLGIAGGRVVWRVDGVYGEGLSDEDLESARARARAFDSPAEA